MSDAREARRVQRQMNIQDTYIRPDDQPWLPFGAPGVDFKLMRVSPETGTWTAIFRCAAGAGFPRHRHLGAGEYLMLEGTMEVRGGMTGGGVTAVAGDYGYEPSGMIHDFTNFPTDAKFYFTNFGAIQFIDDDDKTLMVLDWQGMLALEESMEQQLAKV
jgi:quercetin dioxygenase-like cupin family protein